MTRDQGQGPGGTKKKLCIFKGVYCFKKMYVIRIMMLEPFCIVVILPQHEIVASHNMYPIQWSKKKVNGTGGVNKSSPIK